VPVLDAAGQIIVKEGKNVVEGWVKHNIGSHFVDITTFAATALAMVVGSLLKPKAPEKELL